MPAPTTATAGSRLVIASPGGLPGLSGLLEALQGETDVLGIGGHKDQSLADHKFSDGA
jgi:hypothetical protein